MQKELRRFCKSERIPLNAPFNQLTRPQRNAIINGRGEFDGVRGFFDWLETKKYKLHVRVFLADQPFGRRPRPAGALPRDSLQMTFPTDILSPERSELLPRPDFHMIVISLTCVPGFLSAAPLWL